MKLTKETIKRINNLNNGGVLSSRTRDIIADILIEKNILIPKVFTLNTDKYIIDAKIRK